MASPAIVFNLVRNMGPTFRSDILRAYRRRLTNLSSRNRSLLLTSLPAGQFLDLHEADFVLNKPSFTIVAELMARKAAVPVCDVLDARQERSNEVSRKLRRIDRTARFIEEERGTEDLYVGWPFVQGKFGDGTVVHGPLLFFPVRIEQRGKLWTLVRRGDDVAFLNPTFALAYGQFNQIRLPDEVIEKTADDFDRDPLVFRTQLYEWLKDSPFDIHFNQDLFTDQLRFFNKQTAKTLDQLERTGELKLYPEAVLGIFPQAGSYLVPDYDQLILEQENGPQDADIPSPSASSLLSEKQIHTPLPLDASQEAALRAVKAGQSLVVQGPPGTGKSQLIANLMADAAAGGKRVLLVCQKRAALDVVQARLQDVGIGAFLALIHDFQDDRRALYAQLARQIEQLDTYRQQNNSLNAVLLERDFEVESRRIDEAVAELGAFKGALFDPSLFGLSAKELYLISDTSGQTIQVDDVYQQFHKANVDNFVERLRDFSAYQQRLGTDHPWADRRSMADYTTADQPRIDQTISRWVQTRTDAHKLTTAQLGKPLTLAELADWHAHDWSLTALLALLDTPDADSQWRLLQTLRANPAHPALAIPETRLTDLADTWADADNPETSLPVAELRPFRALLADALAARPSWIRWNWWQLTHSGNRQLVAVAAANRLTLSEADLMKLATQVDTRIRLEAVRYEAGPLLAGLPLSEGPDSLRLLRRVRSILDRLADLPILRPLPEAHWQTHVQFIDSVTRLLALARQVDAEQIGSQSYLTSTQLDRIWSDPAQADRLRQSLRQDFDYLLEADRLQAGFSVAERILVDRLAHTEPTAWTATVQNALHLAWIDALEQQYPVLRMVSSLRMTQLEQALQTSVHRKQVLSQDNLLVKLREQTYRNLTFNRLNNVVTYRDLLHQTTKKRNIWPVRKLMERFADEVFRLVPCWLASPETVSAVFPLRADLFDLVIFDEASQCFAEQGIPAMARGKQIVVTGDNQQLRPSDLYRTRLTDEVDEETPAELEVESLLELASQQLPQLSLTEHYRSRSLDLITFSNTHFYQDKLQLLPHFADVNRHSPAIQYLNVAGLWQQNTNLAEAEAVLTLLDQIAVELPGRSVGIVTFNYQQQQLIQDRLDERITGLPLAAPPPGLFVKNIENVQGDERDVIVFSVGYAPDERGRLTMQFGSLNARGGENRLNVAVTRARERVYVVTSLWPDQLAVENVTNEGPRLLKAYLHYALSVSEGRFEPKPQPVTPVPTSFLLKDKLAAQRPNWQPELPFADLTVKVDQIYRSLILTDDDAYYQQSPKQAHAYLPVALQSRHWPFQRIWSREFWRQSIDGDPQTR